MTEELTSTARTLLFVKAQAFRDAAALLDEDAAWIRGAYPEPRERADTYRLIAVEDCASHLRRAAEELDEKARS